MALIEQALREEKFDLAQPLVQPATLSAAKLKEPPLVNRVKDLSKDLKDQKKEYEAVQSARETLKDVSGRSGGQFRGRPVSVPVARPVECRPAVARQGR